MGPQDTENNLPFKVIDKFTGEYAFLSNFHPSRIIVFSRNYPTVEHAYQALKCKHEHEHNYIQQLATPGQAKRAGRRVVMKEDWQNLKYSIMLTCVTAKFTQHIELTMKLVNTSPSHLEEGNDWGDTLWGTVDGVGDNLLGNILMLVRNNLMWNIQNPLPQELKDEFARIRGDKDNTNNP